MSPNAVEPKASLTSLTSKTGTFVSSGVFTGSGTASKLSAHRDSTNRRFILRLQSYTGNMSEDDFPTSQFISASVYNFRIGLSRVGTDTSISSIEGISGIVAKESGVAEYQTNVLSVLLVGFINLLTDYGLVASVLSAALKGVKGEPYYVDDGRDSFVDVTINTLGTDFDSASAAFPVGFNISTNGVTGTYKGYSNLTYQADTQFALLLVSTKSVTTSSFTIS